MAAYSRLSRNLDSYLLTAAGTVAQAQIGQLQSLEDALVKRVSLIVLDLGSIDDAFLLFETLNSRGLSLSAADLLKSHLLSKAETDGRSSNEAIDAAADAWDDMVDDLGGGDISVFLRHYLLMKHERVRKADAFPL